MDGGTLLIVLVVLGLASWSLAGFVMLVRGVVPPGDVWGWSRTGNLLQSVGLVLVAAVLIVGALAGGRSVLGIPWRVIQFAPWAVVVAGVIMRQWARRRTSPATRRVSTNPRE